MAVVNGSFESHMNIVKVIHYSLKVRFLLWFQSTNYKYVFYFCLSDAIVVDWMNNLAEG